MKTYNPQQQLQIINSCNNALELLEAMDLLKEMQNLTFVSNMVYDLKMDAFLVSNKLTYDSERN